MTLSALLLLSSLAGPCATGPVAAAQEKPEKEDVTVIAAEIRLDGRVVSRPTIHALIGREAAIQQSVEIDGEPVDLQVGIRIDRDRKQRGRLTGKFVYRLPDETVAITERWRRGRHVEHVAGPWTIALELAAP